MYIVIIGCGETGSRLARSLSKSTDNIVIVDSNVKAFDALGDRFNGQTVQGDAMDLDVLEEAGIRQADRVFVLTGNEDINLVVGQVCKAIYEVPRVIVQVKTFFKDYIFSRKDLTIVNRSKVFIDTFKEYLK